MRPLDGRSKNRLLKTGDRAGPGRTGPRGRLPACRVETRSGSLGAVLVAVIAMSTQIAGLRSGIDDVRTDSW